MVKTWKSSGEALKTAFAGRTFATGTSDGTTQFHVSMKRRWSFRLLHIIIAIFTWVIMGAQNWSANGANGLKAAVKLIIYHNFYEYYEYWLIY